MTIAATSYGGFGAVTETLPAGFSYVSANNIDADQVTEEEQTVTFILREANKSFTYTVTASGTAGTYSFSGQLRDSDRADHDVGGAEQRKRQKGIHWRRRPRWRRQRWRRRHRWWRYSRDDHPSRQSPDHRRRHPGRVQRGGEYDGCDLSERCRRENGNLEH